MLATVRAASRRAVRAGRRQQRRGRRRGFPGHGVAAAHRPACGRCRTATGCALHASRPARPGTSVVARTRRRGATRGSSACPAFRARPAPRRSRTSARTARRWPRRSSRSGRTTGPPTRCVTLRAGRVRLRVPDEHFQAQRPLHGAIGRRSRFGRLAAVRPDPVRRTGPLARRRRPATGCRWPTPARPCWRCAPARAWCSTRPIPDTYSVGLVLHQPGAGAADVRRAAGTRAGRRPRRAGRLAGPRRRGQGERGLADRAGRVPKGYPAASRGGASPPSTRSRSPTAATAPRRRCSTSPGRSAPGCGPVRRRCCTPSRSWSTAPSRSHRLPARSVTSPRRQRGGRRAPASRPPAAPPPSRIQRCRTPNVAYGAARRPRPSSARTQFVHRWPGTLWWISAFGSRSANTAGPSSVDSRAASVSERGAAASTACTHEPSRPSSSQRPLDERAARRERAGHRGPRTVHFGLLVLPQHVHRPYQRRPQPAEFEPAAGERQAGGAAASPGGATRAGSISRPTTRTSGRTAAAAGSRLDGGDRVPAVARGRRPSGVGRQAGREPRERSRVDPAQPVRVGRAAGRPPRSARLTSPGAPCAGRPARAGGSPAGRC